MQHAAARICCKHVLYSAALASSSGVQRLAQTNRMFARLLQNTEFMMLVQARAILREQQPRAHVYDKYYYANRMSMLQLRADAPQIREFLQYHDSVFWKLMLCNTSSAKLQLPRIAWVQKIHFTVQKDMHKVNYAWTPCARIYKNNEYFWIAEMSYNKFYTFADECDYIASVEHYETLINARNDVNWLPDNFEQNFTSIFEVLHDLAD